MTTSRILRCCCAVVIATVCVARPPVVEAADEYPSRPIRFITSGGPGGVSDLLARITGDALKEPLGRALVVDNRPGGNNMIAFNATTAAPADGYTVLLGASEMTIVPLMTKSAASFDPLRDLTPVALMVNTWGVLVASPKAPFKSLTELVSYARANPNGIRYGTNGVGSTLHLPVEMLQMAAGIKMLHVPYRATPQTATALLSGDIEIASMSISSAIAGRDKWNMLVQTGPAHRYPLISDVPTTADLGLPDVRVDIWFGMMAPPKTPEPIVRRLADGLDKVLRDPGIRKKLLAIGFDVSYMPPAEFTEYIGAEKRKWGRLIPQWGINIDG